MREMGNGSSSSARTIERRWRAAPRDGGEGLHYSYDMLGEAAMTAADAEATSTPTPRPSRDRAAAATADDRRQPRHLGQALGAAPRYEDPSATASWPSWCRVQPAARMPRGAGIGINIDAEEADRLDLSLDVIEAVLRDPGSPAGTGSAWWCRPIPARAGGDRLARCAGRALTAASWCGW
jgi:RHH-type proline utilization regulon transcriptional repressor/proline dehydrogenase/delta 1-pyrroline-5-carboxylate dehydrogenase